MLLCFCLDSLSGGYYLFLDRFGCIGVWFDYLLVMVAVI